MREDKLPELGANDPIIPHPHLESYWETSKPFLYLIALVSQELKLSGVIAAFWNWGAPLWPSPKMTSLDSQGHSTPLASRTEK